MRIEKLDSIPSSLKFKNKEDFTNRLIQEVIFICKKNSIFLDLNKKTSKVNVYKNDFSEKNEKLDKLLEKSKDMKEIVTNKINLLVENNNNLKNKLLQLITINKEEI